MRPTRGFIAIVVGCVTIFFVFFNSKPSVDSLDNAIGESQEDLFEKRSTENPQIYRYVTPSLAELGARGSLAKMNKHVIMLTRVPDAGAELLVLILQRLQGYNAFKHIRLPPGDNGLLSSLQQELLVEEVTSIIRQEAIPLSFDGDVRFLNFSEFARQAPSYVSLVRNPLDSRTAQRYRYGEENVQLGAIPHFCGQDPRCSERNNKWALQRAKENVLEWYSVVGILDRMEETLNVLERHFPYFFMGATSIYNSLRRADKRSLDTFNSFKTKKKASSMLRLFADELEFYNWLKSRLLDEASEKG